MQKPNRKRLPFVDGSIDTVPVKDFFEWFLNIAHSKKVVSYQ